VKLNGRSKPGAPVSSVSACYRLVDNNEISKTFVAAPDLASKSHKVAMPVQQRFDVLRSLSLPDDVRSRLDDPTLSCCGSDHREIVVG
jgi:hypothetical protein